MIDVVAEGGVQHMSDMALDGIYGGLDWSGGIADANALRYNPHKY